MKIINSVRTFTMAAIAATPILIAPAYSQTGQFIHGNNDISSLGKYASLGCIRMDNEVIKKLAKEVKRGDIVVIRK